MELTPSDHHRPISAEKLISRMERSVFIIEKKKYKYYPSAALSGFNNDLVHFIGRIFDNYFINKYLNGYLFIEIGKNNR